MKVGILCERSGVVREAFRALGHDAWSCDLVPADDGSPYHFKKDCMEVATYGWDLLIAHPSCQYLAVSGNRHYGKGTAGYNKRLESIAWTTELWFLMTKHSTAVAMENPVGALPFVPNQYVQPWMFGHPENKKTGLWLWNLPLLEDTDNVKLEMEALPVAVANRIHHMPPSKERSKMRSVTYQGIADAMAAQWSEPHHVQIDMFGVNYGC